MLSKFEQNTGMTNCAKASQASSARRHKSGTLWLHSMKCMSTIGLLCTCTTCLSLSDTLLHTGKAATTSFDQTGDDIVLSEQEATEDNNEQGETLGNPQEEDLGVGDN